MPIFDGHNDALLRLLKRKGPDAPRAFLDGEGKGQLDLPMARQGGFAGGMFAIFVPSPENKVPARGQASTRLDTAPGAPLPPPLDLTTAQTAVSSMASILIRIEREADGRVRICRTVEDIRHCIDHGALAAVLHIEGAEAIDPEFEDPRRAASGRAALARPGVEPAERVRARRAVPLSRRRPTSGPGLTDLGKELVRACNRLKILIDLSHLNERASGTSPSSATRRWSPRTPMPTP